MYPRKKIGADLIWNFGEPPPADLIKSMRLERAAINHDEWSRAEWFWNRRPKVLSHSPVIWFCYLIVVVCLFYYGFRNIESSIKRALSHLSERK